MIFLEQYIDIILYITSWMNKYVKWKYEIYREFEYYKHYFDTSNNIHRISILCRVIHRSGMRLHMYGIPVVDGILKALVPILLRRRDKRRHNTTN